MQADTIAGDRLEDLCETAQDAVNEVIRGCREHGNGFCRRTFADLNISVMATAFKDGSVRWSIVSLITDKETKNGHAHGNIIPRERSDARNPRPVGKGISWGLNSLVTGVNTKRGIVG